MIPNLAEPLLSVSDITDNDKAVVFLKTRSLIVDQPDQLESWCQNTNVIAGEGSRIHRSYYLNDSNQVSFRTAPVSTASYLTWHLCLGHLHLRSLKRLHKLGHIKILTDDLEDIVQCVDCVKGKMSRINLTSREHHRVGRCLEQVHSDLCQLPCKSCQGSRYMMTFLDEFTHRGVIDFLKSNMRPFPVSNIMSHTQKEKLKKS